MNATLGRRSTAFLSELAGTGINPNWAAPRRLSPVWHSGCARAAITFPKQ